MIRKLKVLLVLLLWAGGIQAQQDAMYSQYMFNPFAINPAYAGSRDALSGVLLHRNQWTGIDGAPKTQSLAVHSRINETALAAGLNLFNDKIGPTRNTGVFLTGAYHLGLQKSKLAFALRTGVYSTRMDHAVLNFKDGSDKYVNTGTIKASVLSFDFGTYYYGSRFFAGLSFSHIGNPALKFDNNAQTAVELRSHAMVLVGHAFLLNKNLLFRPSLLIKAVEGAPNSVDLNANFLLKQKVWLGLGLRSTQGLVLMTEYNITEVFRVGYAYDASFSAIGRQSSGSHELFLGVDLNVFKQDAVSPRYM